MRDSSLRLALLMREAELICDRDWSQYARSQEEGSEQKGMMDILTQSAFSPETYRQLFLYPIKLPFTPSGDKPSMPTAIEEALTVNADELTATLTTNDPGVDTLTDALQRLGERLSPPQVATVSEALTMGSDGYRLLVERGALTPERFDAIVLRAAHAYARPNRMQLAADILALNGLCGLKEFLSALDEAQTTERKVGQVLEDRGVLHDQRLLQRLADGLELPEIDLPSAKISRTTTRLFPGSFIRRHLFVPIKRAKTTLTVAVTDPLFMALSDALSVMTGLVVVPLYAPHDAILDAINTHYPAEPGQPPAPIPSATPPPSQSAGGVVSPEPVSRDALGALGDGLSQISARVDRQSTVRLVSSIIENAIGLRATDIHIEPHPDGVRVRYRVDGVLREITTLPAELLPAVSSRVKVLSDMNVTERRRPQDGQFSLTLDSIRFDFRVSTLPTRIGEKVVIRILDQRTVLKGMGKLGMSDDQEAVLRGWIAKPYGMILVTGPTGSGKSSTLYACLNALNDAQRNIITIEDPVEYQLPGICQVQVDTNIDLTFAAGLRSALRQDPDVLMVGEIRDQETAYIAMRSSLTGHLVLSTLHTNSAIGAVAGLEQLAVAPYVIANALIGVVAQRLLRTLCKNCRRRRKAPENVLRDFGFETKQRPFFHIPKGCDRCMESGYSGRQGVYEFFDVDDNIRELIAHGADTSALEKRARRSGQASLRENAFEKLLNGTTSIDEVMKTVLLT